MRRQNIVPIDKTILFDLSSALVKAVGRLTVSGQPADGQSFVLGSRTYTMKTNLTAAVAATGVLTSDEVQVTAGKKVTVASQVYTFVAALTPVSGPRQYVPNEVLIGADADASMQNLIYAINGTAAHRGTKYSLGTDPNPEMTAGSLSSHAFTVTARVTGTVGNSYAKAEDDAHLDWDGSGGVMTGGVDTVPFQVKIGGSAAATLDNIKSAVNLTGTAGTEYSVGTVANELATATTNADTTQDFEAITPGTPGNSVTFTEGLDNATISGSGTLGGTTAGSSTKGRYVFTEQGFAHRFITVLGDITGTGTLAATLYNAAGVALKALQATQAQSSTADTAYEVEIQQGDYIEFVMSAAVASTDGVYLSVR